MQIAASVDAPLVFAGDRVKMTIAFMPSTASGAPAPDSIPGLTPPTPDVPVTGDNETLSSRSPSSPDLAEAASPPVLLSGYAAVQGSFKIGDMMLPDKFAETRKKGVVLGHHGIEYGKGAAQTNQGLIAGVLGGLKQLMVHETSQTGAYDDVDEGDYPIFTTAQALLFTDLCVDRMHKFELTVDIPADVPPSYRSRSIFITYHLVLGFQSLSLSRSQSSSRLFSMSSRTPAATRLFLPFRVYTRSSSPYDLLSPAILPAPTVITKSVADPGLRFSPQYDEPVSEPNGMSEFIADLLESPSGPAERRRHSVQERRDPEPTQVSFDIAKKGTPIATLVFSRPSVRVGDVLTGTLRLVRPCIHIGAFLELTETIAGVDSAVGDENTIYQTYARQSLGAFGYDEVALSLPTLASITPKFETLQVSASWSLRLDFVGLVGTAFGNRDDYAPEGLSAKGQVDCELFSCRIPINVLPPDSGGHGATKVWAIY